MRFNRQMHAHLLELKSRQVGLALDPTFAARAPLDVEEHSGGVVLLKQPARGWRSRLSVFHDATKLECTANKISVGDLLDPRWGKAVPLLLLTAGLVLTERLARELAKLPGVFNIILSYDGDSCALRFHRVRPGEAWLHADLEEYSEEGVLVCESGEPAQIGLLGS